MKNTSASRTLSSICDEHVLVREPHQLGLAERQTRGGHTPGSEKAGCDDPAKTLMLPCMRCGLNRGRARCKAAAVGLARSACCAALRRKVAP